jgi:hypothetical protein
MLLLREDGQMLQVAAAVSAKQMQPGTRFVLAGSPMQQALHENRLVTPFSRP